MRAGACGGITTTSFVDDTETTGAGSPSADTVAPTWKSAPVSVTCVPPALGPLTGDTFVTVGAGPR